MPGLNQKVVAHGEPVKECVPGHGCGHNIFGTAVMGRGKGLKERDGKRQTSWNDSVLWLSRRRAVGRKSFHGLSWFVR